MTNQIFDTKYGGEKTVEGHKQGAEIKKFLNNPISEEQIKSYGNSKPKRVVIKAKISGS